MSAKRPSAWVPLLSALFLFAVLAGLLAYLTLRLAGRRSAAAPAIPPQPVANASVPPLEVHPMQDLEQLRQKEAGLLGRYAWVDRRKGLVQVPIERAMELVAEEGLPTRKGKKP